MKLTLKMDRLLFLKLAFIYALCSSWLFLAWNYNVDKASEEVSIGDLKTVRILFLGNSYTHYNELPKIVSQLGKSIHDFEIQTEQITPGGATLTGHSNDKETLDKILNENWDYVVLQEQSTRPIDDPERMIESIKKLDRVIRKAGAETILYMTWARKSNPEMITEIARIYNKAAQCIEAKVAPVGLAFEICQKVYPEIGLYDPDGSHPSKEGSYLAGCVIFSTITALPLHGLDGIEKENTLKIQEVVQRMR